MPMDSSRRGLAHRARSVLGLPASLVSRLRQHPPAEPWGLTLTVLLALAATLAGWGWSVSWFPPVFLAIPFLLGGLLLTTRSVRRLAVVVVACLVFDLVVTSLEEVRSGAIVVVLLSGLLAHEYARSRDETGLSGMSADAVLVQLRDRLEQQGGVPRLPAPWCVEAVVDPAGGGPFAGDFVVSALVDAVRFEVALVDVSGKGVEAGTRSLLLSGAMGGLLGSASPQEFLAASNAYLIRQDWEEGFATAVHLTVDLRTGDFAVASAGHPPVAHLDAGSGRWSLLDTEGAALGLLRETAYRVATGRLRPGDAVLLYTDGLVEIPGRDLDRGIDKLLGEAERLVTRGFEGGGRVLVQQVSGRSFDDQGLVLLWRQA
ncbi:MAG TPA: PP2C family protein-serine/threonine phosphatase [Mycobacteriales bacterium]|nr:PP2C family protein-serine/threonine phosphatase [Mycobacteriales bacterium]